MEYKQLPPLQCVFKTGMRKLYSATENVASLKTTVRARHYKTESVCRTLNGHGHAQTVQRNRERRLVKNHGASTTLQNGICVQNAERPRPLRRSNSSRRFRFRFRHRFRFSRRRRLRFRRRRGRCRSVGAWPPSLPPPPPPPQHGQRGQRGQQRQRQQLLQLPPPRLAPPLLLATRGAAAAGKAAAAVRHATRPRTAECPCSLSDKVMGCGGAR